MLIVQGNHGELLPFRGVCLGEVKARPKDIISFSLDYNKQKLSTDKQSIIKPHFTRHAGKAGGFKKLLRTRVYSRKTLLLRQEIHREYRAAIAEARSQKKLILMGVACCLLDGLCRAARKRRSPSGSRC